MNNGEIIGKVHNSMYQQLKKSGVAAPVQVLVDVGALSGGFGALAFRQGGLSGARM